MSSKKFYLQWIIITLLMGTMTAALVTLPSFRPYLTIGVSSIFLFSFISFVAFILGKKTAHSINPNTFTAVVMGLIVAKMFFATALIVIFSNIQEIGNHGLIIFFINYIVFSIFEYAVLSRIGSSRPQTF